MLAVKERMKKTRTQLQTDEATAAYLARCCCGRSGGAREIRRMIRNLIETPAAELLLAASGELKLQTVIEDGNLQLVRVS